MASLRDGLGGEEIQVSGIEVSGTYAVYVSPYFLGSVTTEDQISGANIYSTAALHGENVYGDTVVSGATVKGTAISGDNFVNDVGELQSVVAGSAYGAIIQAGSLYVPAGSGNIAFNTTYAGAPVVTASIGSYSASLLTTALAGGSAWVATNAVSTTGCELICGLGSDGVLGDGPLIYWMSVGI